MQTAASSIAPALNVPAHTATGVPVTKTEIYDEATHRGKANQKNTTCSLGLQWLINSTVPEIYKCHFKQPPHGPPKYTIVQFLGEGPFIKDVITFTKYAY